MEAKMMFVDCPGWPDEDGAVRCGLPAEVSRRYTMPSTGGPVESAMIRCPAGHWFNGPLEFLTWDSSRKHASGMPERFQGSGRDAAEAAPSEPEIAAAAQAGRQATCDAQRRFWAAAAAYDLLPPGTDLA